MQTSCDKLHPCLVEAINGMINSCDATFPRFIIQCVIRLVRVAIRQENGARKRNFILDAIQNAWFASEGGVN